MQKEGDSLREKFLLCVSNSRGAVFSAKIDKELVKSEE